MKNRLLWKLLLTNIVPVIIVIIIVIWVAIDHLAAAYFMDLMDNYSISPKELHQMFLTSIHHYLGWAGLVAVAVAIILSFLITRRVLKPLSEMTQITDRYASGNFSSRVDVTTSDEVGELGTAFNRMADSLEQIEQLRKNMVADAAHELRTPLTNLCGYLEAVNDEVLPPTKENMTILQKESLHLKRLVEELQQLARADAAKGMLNRSEVDIVHEMQQMLKLYHHRFEQKEISIRSSFPDVPSLYVDKAKLLQAMRNLFENCWKYTPAKGWVELKITLADGELKTIFSNSGPGINNQDLPFIFERFFRTDRSRSREAGGFGIGLAITKELIEAQGGSVGADSNQGRTDIWFVLPVNKYEP